MPRVQKARTGIAKPEQQAMLCSNCYISVDSGRKTRTPSAFVSIHPIESLLNPTWKGTSLLGTYRGKFQLVLGAQELG